MGKTFQGKVFPIPLSKASLARVSAVGSAKEKTEKKVNFLCRFFLFAWCVLIRTLSIDGSLCDYRSQNNYANTYSPNVFEGVET